MIKYLSSEEKPLSRDLWEEAFPEDSRSFGDFYYREKIKENRILAICEDERVQAMIQMNPYLIQAGSRRWRVDYLVGVATRKEKRHQGYMSRLLGRMMADMREEQMPFCFLMPADEAIYRPFGFTFIFKRHWYALQEGIELTRRTVETRKTAVGNLRYLGWLADWMDRWLEQRYQVYTVRDTEYLVQLLDEIASENGTMDVLYDGDTMVGIQSIWGWEEKEQLLLYCEAPYVYEAAEPRPAIMARIITPEQFVRAVHLKKQAPEDELTIWLYLEDPLIEENRGLWLWHLDRETSWLERSSWKNAEKAPEGCENLHLTITELTTWLFGYDMPAAAKPFEDRVESLKNVFLDEEV